MGWFDQAGIWSRRRRTRATAMTRCRLCLTGFAVAACVFAAVAPAGAADPVAEVYAGKTIRVLIGVTTRRGYDIYARTLARPIGPHIPRPPPLPPPNTPGARTPQVLNHPS